MQKGGQHAFWPWRDLFSASAGVLASDRTESRVTSSRWCAACACGWIGSVFASFRIPTTVASWFENDDPAADQQAKTRKPHVHAPPVCFMRKQAAIRRQINRPSTPEQVSTTKRQKWYAVAVDRILAQSSPMS